MDQSGAPLAVSLSCDINTGKNQSDCTNCLKCLRIPLVMSIIGETHTVLDSNQSSHSSHVGLIHKLTIHCTWQASLCTNNWAISLWIYSAIRNKPESNLSPCHCTHYWYAMGKTVARHSTGILSLKLSTLSLVFKKSYRPLKMFNLERLFLELLLPY